MFMLNYSFTQYMEFGLRIIVACACGALIGYEREKKYKDAGLRTHVIVCCSAALMMIVSKYGFSDIGENISDYILGTKGADPARIAAQVISGVSFIGAGVIFHNKNNTKGLTTASGLWAIAGVGITVGAGMYGVGVFTTLLIFIIQNVIRDKWEKKNAHILVKLKVVATNSEDIREKLEDYVEELSDEIREESIAIDGNIISYKLVIIMKELPTLDHINSLYDMSSDISNVRMEQLV